MVLRGTQRGHCWWWRHNQVSESRCIQTCGYRHMRKLSSLYLTSALPWLSRDRGAEQALCPQLSPHLSFPPINANLVQSDKSHTELQCKQDALTFESECLQNHVSKMRQEGLEEGISPCSSKFPRSGARVSNRLIPQAQSPKFPFFQVDGTS